LSADPLVQSLEIPPGGPARVAKRSPGDKLGLDGKTEGAARLGELLTELNGLHRRLWAESARSVLLVLQGMDTAGKDSTVRHVLSGLNPQGCQVTSFKVPNDADLAHDYLWRVHAACPDRGRLGVFNRSHYEDVLAARFGGAVSAERCRRRYRHLREFERLLVDEGTTVVKVFLHLSKEEQTARLERRLGDPTRAWKFEPSDLDARREWNDYQAIYEEVLSETSTVHAPWFAVPADRKWVRDIAVATLLVETLRRLDPQIPAPDPSLADVVVR
jgi:PPK2 family polyphosphate:nucleotide phosphotransferase